MGRLQWLRLDCDIDQLPKARRAGYGGVAIWIALARVSAQFDLGECIPPDFADPGFLADHLGADVQRITDDLRAAITAGLVAQEQDGSLVLGMDRFTNPDTAKKRERRAVVESKPESKPDCPGLSRTVPDSPGQSGTVPLRDETGHNSTVRTIHTEIEGDPGEEDSTRPAGAVPVVAVAPTPVSPLDKKEKPKSKAKPEEPPCPYQQIVALYHECCPSLPRVEVLTPTVQAHVKARWKDIPAKNGNRLAFFRAYFERVSRSDFLSGRTSPSRGRKPFCATFPWLVGPENFGKVVNGSFDPRESEFDRRMKELEAEHA